MTPIEFTEAGDPVFRSVRARTDTTIDDRLPEGGGIVIAMVVSMFFWIFIALWAWTSGGAFLAADGLEACHEDR